MKSFLKDLVIPLIIIIIPIFLLYYLIGTAHFSPSENDKQEYAALKRKYVFPASVLFQNGGDLENLRELDQQYTAQLEELQATFGETFEEGNSKIYCIPPDNYAFTNVTAFSPSASYLYQNIENIHVNPVYYCNITLMKNTEREEKSEHQIVRFSNPELKLHPMGDIKASINDFLVQAFPLQEGQTDFLDYIEYREDEGLYCFYCADFRGDNANLYGIYFSFYENGEFSAISYDNTILYGNDLVKCYDCETKDLYATFHKEIQTVNDKISTPAINLNTIIGNTHDEIAGTLVIKQLDYISDDFLVAARYSCSLTLQTVEETIPDEPVSD
ncbi:MAG: hypothetical protein V3G42_10705 [Oscillospiraceae bacterium]